MTPSSASPDELRGADVLALLAGQRVSPSRPSIPMTPLSGVRSSWLMLATNSDFERVAASAARVATPTPPRSRAAPAPPRAG